MFKEDYGKSFEAFLVEEKLDKTTAAGFPVQNLTYYCGVQCGVCGPKAGMRHGSCEECPEGGANFGILFGMAAVVIVVVIAMVTLQVRKGEKDADAGEHKVRPHFPLTKVQQRYNIRNFGTYSGEDVDAKSVMTGLIRIFVSYTLVMTFVNKMPMK